MLTAIKADDALKPHTNKTILVVFKLFINIIFLDTYKQALTFKIDFCTEGEKRFGR